MVLLLEPPEARASASAWYVADDLPGGELVDTRQTDKGTEIRVQTGEVKGAMLANLTRCAAFVIGTGLWAAGSVLPEQDRRRAAQRPDARLWFEECDALPEWQPVVVVPTPRGTALLVQKGELPSRVIQRLNSVMMELTAAGLWVPGAAVLELMAQRREE